MTPPAPVLSHSAFALNRRDFMVLGGIGMCGVLAAYGGEDSTENEGTGPLCGTVTMWSSLAQGSRTNRMRKMAEEFHRRNLDVAVKIEQFSWFEFRTRWAAGLTAGQVPDVSTVLPNDTVGTINSEAPVPLDKVIGSIGRDRFPKQALAEGQLDGRSCPVPIYSYIQTMWYHKDVLGSKELFVPATWEELVKAVKATGKFDSLYGLFVSLGTRDMLGACYPNFYVCSASQRLLKDNGTASLTSEAVPRGIKYWTDLYKSVSLEGSLDHTVFDQVVLFYQGKTAFDFNSGFHISGIAKDNPSLVDSIIAVPLPHMKASDPVNYPTEVSNVPLVVWEASKVKREAKAFLEFLFTKDKYIELLHSAPGDMLSVLSDTAKGPSCTSNEAIKKYSDSIKVIQDQVGVGTAISMERGPPIQVGVFTGRGLIEKMYHSIIIDRTNVKATAKDCEKKLNGVFKAAGTSIK